jgi:hypothetical protein
MDRLKSSFPFEVIAMCAGAAACIALSIAFWVGVSYYESRSYNRLTGAETTTWDAMFLQLRVEAAPIKHGTE